MRISPQWVARGDADILIEKWRKNKSLSQFLRKSDLIHALNERMALYSETVFDFYRYVPERPREIGYHRAIIFLWDDEKWYILDPIDGMETTSPQDFLSYIDADPHHAEWFLQIPGYSMTQSMNYDDFLIALPFVSPELYSFFQRQSLQIPRKFKQSGFVRG
jgi:hypothetical protein